MKKISLLIALLFGGVVLGGPVANADEGEIGFTISPNLPENQIDKEAGYFDLRMTPGQEQTIEVSVINQSTQDAVYDININQANTNESGFVDYSENLKDKDESMKYATEDIVNTADNIAVPAGETVNVPITITMPDEEFDGEILAGIQVLKEEAEDEQSSGFKNEYAYLIGLRLTMNDNKVMRELNLKGIEVDETFGESAVIATLQNPTMDAIGKMDYVGKIYPKDDKENPIHEFSYVGNEMSMAPNSIYNFAITMGSKELKAGEYVVDFTVNDAQGNQWEFNEEFTITKEKAEAVNEIVIADAPKAEAGIPGWAFAVGGILTGLVIMMGILLLKKQIAHSKN